MKNQEAQAVPCYKKKPLSIVMHCHLTMHEDLKRGRLLPGKYL
uniref:Uncharacterized protein n=1 Tax=Anguilla anguilla TaxID=7936 RepID=A0A0E9WCL5_ANGAN